MLNGPFRGQAGTCISQRSLASMATAPQVFGMQLRSLLGTVAGAAAARAAEAS